ncbi:MAG: Hpt domain-containing protein [Firmicutes bacterium]|nr:Hpt domain-containing protein [Bacillota bacterium]
MEAFLPYIDIDAGLALLGNNKKLYARLLKSFLATMNFDELKGLVDGGQLAEAKDKAHALKGVSGNLHLTKNFLLLKEFEMCLKEGKDFGDVFAELMAAAQKTNEEINRLLPLLEG